MPIQGLNLEPREDTSVSLEQNHTADIIVPSVASDEEFRVLGYLPDYQNISIGSPGLEGSIAISNKPQGPMSLEMGDVLRSIPPKPYADALVQNFLDDVNYHYYSLYPPAFSQDYAVWWAGKSSGQPLTPEFTCLLLRVCACSLAFLDAKACQKLETDLGESTRSLSERYHLAAQRLSNTILPGQGGLIQVQQLFLTAFWFKTEARFIESWHALSSTIHEAQELGMHKGSFKSGISEFDQEMRKRIWCLLYCWDWQFAIFLSRPCIIHSAYCSFELPNMRLECSEEQLELPSPITHVLFQAQLGRALSHIPGVIGGTVPSAHAATVQQEVEKWFASFPPAYRITNPDSQWDTDYRYVTLQRHQLHAIGYMTRLIPLKTYLTKCETDIPDNEKIFQSTAVECSLKLMETSHKLLECILPANAKFHYATFMIFDTAAFLCSAILHDRNRNLPQRGDVIETIRLALNVIEMLRPLTKTAALCYPVLAKIAATIPLPSERVTQDSKPPESSNGGSKTPSQSRKDLDEYPANAANIADEANSPGLSGAGIYGPIPLELPTSAMVPLPTSGLGDLSSLDLGELSRIWDWETLDLDLSSMPPAF
ncbi:hypothetical protein ASPWEDRAFT_172145 [Aspergillus wentii DTO 134E9]|uniref:Xylanolytic transcriptional activator regulatory domain-containing protein n=1 Tax=Aspergillus wentii DTO 134E9 TaxID=1073089 RepID=A0A1L9RK98_ASPWE|nr:uncharacterized protein ASPWEDRAFT_172145 [Aspergillus wentii DTO 134E9]OJJ35331.1 hypothetical protein ASPWEDRAFT_172145 [Aspergillus wentii DTO 134E9]